ncbi:keratin, type I cytoskeletal 10 isoform X1 [Drosophila nasuta]|uniref:Keratin, type I cytoskeletal 10 isoform X1 n=1 Tax=Drosophila albomicans TaxID=7291 RepID=A0A6P8XKV8_DROAB|nr:keratin, type I cytoskeletal 10 isoform X1 [Drosophila albomicans]XP_034113503.1 keratin, type I cytoskeletal 10 isoform X1 [Drosophila albomicans]XP_060664949.1 keratin, type I cytoskeletal 10 isoform X1 [Drosophila nasuta]
MRKLSTHQIAALVFCSAVCLINASPLPQPAGNQELDMLQIPLANGKEIDVLTIGTKDQEQLIADRNKRTIGLLRELFPDITKNGATDTKIDLSAINKQLEETIRVARQVKEAEAAAAAQTVISLPVSQAPIPLKSNEPIQLSFNNELNTVSAAGSGASGVKTLSTNDLQLSESKSPAIDELSLDSTEDTADLDDRNKSNLFKRFLSFGGAGLAGGSSGGAAGGGASGNSLGGGGSGNFLLDAVRLFSGSVQTQQGDEAANSVSGGSSSSGDETDAGSDSTRASDGYTEGIPGPVTRLVVLANRGLANLVQDLILRVAATSEKFVNFKAKLITALI